MTSMISTPATADSRILVLGAGGRLGQILLGHWPVRGQLQGHSRRVGKGMVQFDLLSEPEAIKQVAAHVSTVICLSGITPAHANATGDAMKLNTDLALAALEGAPDGARVFVASSAAVYGAAKGPHIEGSNVTPVSDYGHAKLAMERAVLARGQGRICVLRIGNVAGADAILGGWRAGMMLDRLPDGRTPRRSYIGPGSLACAIHALCIASEVPDVVNIAAPGAIQMGALLDAADRDWTPREPDAGVIANVALDTTLLEQHYTFERDECTAEGMVAQWQKGMTPE